MLVFNLNQETIRCGCVRKQLFFCIYFFCILPAVTHSVVHLNSCRLGLHAYVNGAFVICCVQNKNKTREEEEEMSLLWSLAPHLGGLGLLFLFPPTPTKSRSRRSNIIVCGNRFLGSICRCKKEESVACHIRIVSLYRYIHINTSI